jgi:hypothetical protein
MKNKYALYLIFLNLPFLLFSCLEQGNTQSLSSTSEDNVIPRSVIVDKNGNMGIWTLTPATLLHVQNQSGDYGSFMLGGNTANNNHYMTHENDGSFNIYDGVFGSGTNRFRISSTGLVGLGTSTPSQKLTVSNGSVAIDNAQKYFAADSSGTYRNVASINASNIAQYGDTGGILQLTFSNLQLQEPLKVLLVE